MLAAVCSGAGHAVNTSLYARLGHPWPRTAPPLNTPPQATNKVPDDKKAHAHSSHQADAFICCFFGFCVIRLARRCRLFGTGNPEGDLALVAVGIPRPE